MFYIQAVDGKLYNTPIITVGEDFYVCFDDNDPPEAVIKIGRKMSPATAMKKIRRRLREAEVKAKTHDLRKEIRMFQDGFAEAYAVYFHLKAPIPVPTIHHGITDMYGHDVPGLVFSWEFRVHDVLLMFAAVDFDQPTGIALLFGLDGPYDRKAIQQRVCKQHPMFREFRPRLPYVNKEQVAKAAELIIGKYGISHVRIRRE